MDTVHFIICRQIFSNCLPKQGLLPLSMFQLLYINQNFIPLHVTEELKTSGLQRIEMYLFLLFRKHVLRYTFMALSCYQSPTQTCTLHLTGQNLIIWTNPTTGETDHTALTNKIGVNINGKQRILVGNQTCRPNYIKLTQTTCFFVPMNHSLFNSQAIPHLSSLNSTIRLATRLPIPLLHVELTTPPTCLYKLISYHIKNCIAHTCLHHSL